MGDGLVVGCAEGICGSELFGHPMAEVVQVWRDELDRAGSNFRAVVFALGNGHKSSKRHQTVMSQPKIPKRKYVIMCFCVLF